jgi:hypothetical protein
METTYTDHESRDNCLLAANPCIARDRAYTYRTGSKRLVTLPPSGDAAKQFRARDIAHNLGSIIYFPESWELPFTAAQYAVELSVLIKDTGPLIALQALLFNSHEYCVGHRPWQARAAEFALQPRSVVEDARDRLEQQLKRAIFAALEIPDLGNRQADVNLLILHVKERLDATLERDIGAAIDRSRERMAPPLTRTIKPMARLQAVERWLRLYQDLTALSGLPAKE